MTPPSAHPSLIGDSHLIDALRRRIRTVAPSDCPVLIEGETGTGKDLVARLLHSLSPYNPFVVADCTCLHGNLFESELFGHEKGAFTGAICTKPGLVELADGGTLFLDEVGELPLTAQPKLLRLLEAKEFRRVGATATRRSAFRLLAATHRDLKTLVERGRFREDLYYRISVIKLRVPPLRDRPQDIPALVNDMLAAFGKGLTIDPADMFRLTQYSWPGNIRQLRNCLYRLVTLADAPQISLAGLPTTVASLIAPVHISSQAPPSAPVNASGIPSQGPEPLSPSMRDIERNAIAAALSRSHGNRARAAAALKLSRTTLYRKVRQYHLTTS